MGLAIHCADQAGEMRGVNVALNAESCSNTSSSSIQVGCTFPITEYRASRLQWIRANLTVFMTTPFSVFIMHQVWMTLICCQQIRDHHPQSPSPPAVRSKGNRNYLDVESIPY